MKLGPIPEATKQASKEADKKNPPHLSPWWRVRYKDLPEQAILAVSTGKGPIRPGCTVYLIGGHDREVFPVNADKYKLHEYVGLVDGTGWQPLVQLGRDVEML